MSVFSSLRTVLAFRLRRRRAEREMEAELRFHLQRQVETLERQGVPREQAERQARIAFGGYQRVEEECREALGTRWLGETWADIRYGLRQLRRNPGFTAVAILTLALGIGANTALFSVVNAVVLNPLPYPHPGRLVEVDASKPNFPRGSISYPNFLDWHRLNRCFSAFAVSRSTGFLLTGAGSPQELNAAAITSDFFPMLGIKPVLGRNFTPAEDEVGVGHVVAISTQLWHRSFDSSPSVIGREISLDGRGYTIVGVFPGHLDLPESYFAAEDAYLPLGEFRSPAIRYRAAGLGIHGIARLKPGVSLQQARSEMQMVTGALARTYPNADRGMGATLTPLKQSMVGGVRGSLLLLLGAVGIVLLIACANVANLLLARGEARRQEVSIRSALGASAGRLMRQMLTESVLLAGLGGALGLALAAAGTRAAVAALPAALPRAGAIAMDGRVLGFTLVISLLAGVLFGLPPAVRAARRSLYSAVKERGGASGSRTQGLLVCGQMALALVLLAGGGLLLRTLSQLWRVNPGFDPDHVMTFYLNLPPAMDQASPARIRAALRNFDATVASVPGVQAVSLSWGAFPMYSEDDQTFWIAGQPRPASQEQMPGMLDYIVGPQYRKAMRIPLLQGRFFTPGDNEHSRLVVVVDQALAQQYFPKGNALGSSLCQGGQDQTTCYEIVGVAGHVLQWGLDAGAGNALRAEVYFPFQQMPDDVMRLVPSSTSVVVRTSGPALEAVNSIQAASRRLSPDEVVEGFATMHGIIQSSLAPRRFAMLLLGSFALLALVLAAIGLYGVMAYAVGRRTRELAVRLALGARRGEVVKMVMAQGLRWAGLGVGLGLVAALALTRLLSGLLYGVSPFDPLSLLAVSCLLAGVALLATYLPARRALRVDPTLALRQE
ncbi:MAG: ADOP family duplicated permease [Terriglobales bacterium]